MNDDFDLDYVEEVSSATEDNCKWLTASWFPKSQIERGAARQAWLDNNKGEV